VIRLLGDVGAFHPLSINFLKTLCCPDATMRGQNAFMKTYTSTHPTPATEARQLMAGKPVCCIPSNTSIAMSDGFAHKKLTTDPVMNLGDACVYSCAYCYVESAAQGRHNDVLGKLGVAFQDVIIRRCGSTPGETSLDTLKRQMVINAWRQRAKEFHTAFTSSTVDPAPNGVILEETAQAMALLFQATCWDIRVLSKSANLQRLATRVLELAPGTKNRMILGVSTGTLDDKLAQAIEMGTPLVSRRIQSLRRLQDEGFRTFGMICPSLPQTDYKAFSAAICEAIRVETCEQVWAEPLNVRGKSFTRTIEALEQSGFFDEADALRAVTGKGKRRAWEDYAKETFLAHTANVPAEKLHFLHYPSEESLPWWNARRRHGAVLLGKVGLSVV
jgi:DNA repair photolyase